MFFVAMCTVRISSTRCSAAFSHVFASAVEFDFDSAEATFAVVLKPTHDGHPLGVQPPVGFWDPLGLSVTGSLSAFS